MQKHDVHLRKLIYSGKRTCFKLIGKKAENLMLKILKCLNYKLNF